MLTFFNLDYSWECYTSMHLKSEFRCLNTSQLLERFQIQDHWKHQMLEMWAVEFSGKLSVGPTTLEDCLDRKAFVKLNLFWPMIQQSHSLYYPKDLKMNVHMKICIWCLQFCHSKTVWELDITNISDGGWISKPCGIQMWIVFLVRKKMS